MEDIKYLEILRQMTLEEKASLCSGLTFWLTKPVERLGVPSVWMSDGPHGLRKEKASAGTNIMRPAETATCFPPESTVACSWDEELIGKIGSAIAEEAKALKVATVLGPGINIKRSPLCGRNFEYLSEDPYLTGKMGAAYVNGVQKENIGVSLKHFCANNQEHIRMSIDTRVDERTLREIYLSAFEYVVKNAKPQTVMSSYNRVNGTYMTENKRLLTDVLRDEWGFDGIVISDWGAMNDRIKGVQAGNDLEMPGNKGFNDRNIIKAVECGELDEEDLDKIVLRLIKYAFESKEKEVENAPQKLDEHHEIARKAAAESAVLLKNEGKILPLKGTENIAVIGTLAKTLRYQGAGSSHINPPKTVSFVQAMEEEGKSFTYAPGYTLKGDGYNAKLIKEAKKAAEGKDAVLVFIGLTDAYESEGFDRKHIEIPKAHGILVNEIAEVNKNIVVVLAGGSPVNVTEWEENAKGILNVYLGGQAGGEATRDVIFGKVNPSGKLPETYPLSNDALSAEYFPMGPRSVEYRESVYVGYRYYDSAKKEVRYPFGYGLSYTEFEYSGLKLSAEKIKEGEPLTATVTVKNIGKTDGAEIVQLYVKDIESTVFRPEKELKGFRKVFLKAGESKEITFELDSRSFAYYNVLISDWHIESGEFEIMVGASSRDIKYTAKVYVESANPDAEIPDYRKSAPSYYRMAEGTDKIPDEEFTALGVELVGNEPFKVGELTVNNSVGQVAVSPVGKFLCGTLKFGSKLVALGAENPEMITQSVVDMPLRSFSGFTGGLVSQMSVDGLVDMCNRKKGGFKKFCAGFKKKNR